MCVSGEHTFAHLETSLIAMDLNLNGSAMLRLIGWRSEEVLI